MEWCKFSLQAEFIYQTKVYRSVDSTAQKLFAWLITSV